MAVNFMIRAVIGMALIFFINQYVIPPESSINVGLNAVSFLTSGMLGIPGVGLLSDFVSFLQKTADLKFVVDKIESAVYNAFYRQRSTVGTSVFEGKQIFKNPGVKKTGYRIFLFVLYSSRQNSNYDGKTI